MRKVLPATICAFVALTATGGSTARPLPVVRFLDRGEAFTYKNLGCEYPAATPELPDPVVYCFMFNYKGPVPNSVGFAAAPGWAFLLRSTPTGLHVLKTFEQPGAGAEPQLITGRLPSILGVATLDRTQNGDEVRFDGTSLLANDVLAPGGKGPELGVFPLDSSGAVPNNTFIPILSRPQVEMQKFVQGSGTTGVAQAKEPRTTPNLDAASAEIEDALAVEKPAVAAFDDGRTGKGRQLLNGALASLHQALEDVEKARARGEFGRTDELARFRTEVTVEAAIKEDRDALDAKTDHAAAGHVANANASKEALVKKIALIKRRALSLK